MRRVQRVACRRYRVAEGASAQAGAEGGDDRGWGIGLTAESSSPERKKRTVGKPFAKGQSGNPGGKPKALREVIELAREHTELAVGRLAHWAASNEPAASVAASKELLDRAWGKARDHVTIAGETDAPLGLTVTFVGKRPD